MENIPYYIPLLFAGTTAFAIYLFYRAANRSKKVLAAITGWLLLQAVIGLTGFYTVTNSRPPHFLFLTFPPLLFILSLFITRKGRQWLDSLNIKTLTLLHMVRIPVEIVLFLLFTYKTVPSLMTFEGRNFDIISGLSAPLIYLLCFSKHKTRRSALLVWNLVCLGLLINIVAIAVLSAPLPFQQLSFEQPNRAILYFPYIWLPGFVVPVVLLSHLAAMRQLLFKREPIPGLA
ncbi:hypothetical protein SAMN04488505_1011334 [Chitinophaga rupis]|uniref:Uncharacterized protein n=1 Tax=Chitinophaga rupis TaxID=573321 RepID=A0A1H7LTS1_9BACT|nr:hypothetical protein [Chitinophaga rupis]SEL02312.1 hypothetical protein SAMN04488505_1011334 [Chitinophaga rupis]